MKKEDESYESVNLPNTEARLAPLLYIFKRREMNDESNKQCTQT